MFLRAFRPLRQVHWLVASSSTGVLKSWTPKSWNGPETKKLDQYGYLTFFGWFLLKIDRKGWPAKQNQWAELLTDCNYNIIMLASIFRSLFLGQRSFQCDSPICSSRGLQNTLTLWSLLEAIFQIWNYTWVRFWRWDDWATKQGNFLHGGCSRGVSQSQKELGLDSFFVGKLSIRSAKMTGFGGPMLSIKILNPIEK